MFGSVEAMIVDLDLREVVCTGTYDVVKSLYEQMKIEDPFADHLVFSVAEEYFPYE